MWGAVTNTSYDGMPTSLGIVRGQIQCLCQGSVADKPSTCTMYVILILTFKKTQTNDSLPGTENDCPVLLVDHAEF